MNCQAYRSAPWGYKFCEEEAPHEHYIKDRFGFGWMIWMCDDHFNEYQGMYEEYLKS